MDSKRHSSVKKIDGLRAPRIAKDTNSSKKVADHINNRLDSNLPTNGQGIQRNCKKVSIGWEMYTPYICGIKVTQGTVR